MIKRRLAGLFVFSKKEYNGLFILAVILLFITFLPDLDRYLFPARTYDNEVFKKEVEEYKRSLAVTAGPEVPASGKHEVRGGGKFHLFHFDPNNLPAERWRALGLSDRQIKVIRNYEGHGGRFRRKEDLRKVYSIPEWQYRQLEPFIVIRNVPGSAPATGPLSERKADRRLVVVELNGADSLQLLSVRGIGPAFASRIIKYRRLLGGYWRKEQLREVYGLDSLKYTQLVGQVSVDSSKVTRIDINSVSLPKHPYLTYKQLNTIVEYRKQHGNYTSIEDLRKVKILNEDILRKIAPYLKF